MRENVKFQSHIGAIRMILFIKDHPNAKPNFNPTLVQLECPSELTKTTHLCYFNPTLVQLECGSQVTYFLLPKYFNPTLVQLES